MLPFELPALATFAANAGDYIRGQALCPVRALSRYVAQTQATRSSDQLFVCFANTVQGKPLSKPRLSHWIVEAISIAYKSKALDLHDGVHAHSTRGLTTSWVLFEGIPVEDICAAADWASLHTLRFYRLDTSAATVAWSLLTLGVSGHGPPLL